ncbi:(2Fe-2S)-binding protein [Kitasatospora sp. NBC_01302]|uniref:(2Fe-2S)-binding protein n=1 Tax=Kitasatospora sp. NBC_01302 TaxID=2903575 RepID=UPI002E11CFD5|nr:iron-sulfur protein [Kitasatospora sp. NBC_01302]
MVETLMVPPGLTPRTAPELLADACRQLNADCPALRVRVCEEGGPGSAPEPTGWVAARDFAQRMDELVAGEARRIRADHGCAVPPHVSAARLLHHYLWSVCLLAVGPWYLERRVPVLGADQLWIAPHSGELAFRPGGFACLSDDPAARGVAGVRVVPGGSELRAELRAAVAEHAEPVLEAFRPVAKRGSRALWGMVTDDLVSALWYLGRELGREEDAVARAAELLPGGTAPMVGSADFRRLAGSGGAEHLTRTRLGCCLYYVVRPADTCITCPRTGDGERVRRLEA